MAKLRLPPCFASEVTKNRTASSVCTQADVDHIATLPSSSSSKPPLAARLAEAPPVGGGWDHARREHREEDDGEDAGAPSAHTTSVGAGRGGVKEFPHPRVEAGAQG